MIMRTTASNIFKAISTRLLFVGHALLAIYMVTVISNDSKMWHLAWILVTLLIETIIAIIYRKGDECKWVSGSIICYLATTIPCTWITEFHLLDLRTRSNQGTGNNDVTYPSNTTHSPNTKIILPINISPGNFTDLIEQLTMLMLILGRWLLPKGSLTRESLSQLLLVNLAMSADIIEFFDILKLAQTRVSKDLTITILSLWTISLLQFPLNATAKLGDEIREEVSPPSNTNAAPNHDINKNSVPNYIKRHGRRQSRVSVDYSCLQAPLSDRKLSIIAPQNRRLSFQHAPGPPAEEVDDILETHVKIPRTHRHSMAVGMIDRLNVPDVSSRDMGHQSRRLSVDVNSTRYNNLRENMQGLANQMPRRYSRDVQGNSNKSRASVDISADRMTARFNFERAASLESNETTAEGEGPKHRVTMDLICTLMALFLQDGPFLTFRLYMIAKHSAFEYMIVFLTVKNALLLTLQIYKLCVQHCVCHDHKDNDFSPENHVDAMSRLNNVQIAVIHEENETRKSEPSKKKKRGRYNRLSVRWSRTKTSITGTGPLFYSRA
ncbi:uncharacterized protein LOC116295034 [Actinia tenebrosa]|uniref:Uncharacterized protein LOC116295034 n=1 Tax=Actinia tenebrosa TaxID=6105 RepID=A0A6P8I132_ACTTE|nr:uncharacterized protein LOC116295034 [Actinia tenebrosa]